MSFVKLKATFMIVLLIFISFSLYIPRVSAQQQECCERTKDGAFCVYTDISNCEGPNHAPAFCEDTSFCTLGCCFDSDSGECFSNSAKSECDNIGGTWDSTQSCSQVSQCSIGCCQLNNQGFLSTLTKCKQVSSQFSDTEPNFDASIQDEFSCVNSVRSQEQGCCVTPDSCTFTTRSECGQQQINPSEALGEEVPGEDLTGQQIASGKAIGFHPDTLCSLDSLGCTAAKQHSLGCFNEDVYWFDSEGNQENVFLGDSGPQKRAAYNNGRVLDDPGCQATPNDPNCGNCDYTQGTICSDKDGEPRCEDINCKDTTRFPNSPDSGSSKELGDSWCIFDGPVGFGQDRPGSRHFRASCINGEEVIEPCQDFREEFCTQAISQGQQTNQFGSIYQALTQNLPTLQGSNPISNIFQGPTYTEGACRENRANSCLQCNEFSTPQEIQQCCNELAYRDCYFLQAGVSDKGGTCVPNVPQGARFWSDSQSVLQRQTTQTTDGVDEVVIDNVPSVPADDVCFAANQECEVGFSRTTFSDWKCTYNCHCLRPEGFIAAHSVCRSIGDCGASVNFAGEITRKGFDIKVLGPKGEIDVPSGVRENVNYRQFLTQVDAGLFDDKLVREPQEGGGPKDYDISDFFSDSAIPFALIGFSGLLGVGTGAGGFVSGLLFGPSFALGAAGQVVNAATSALGGSNLQQAVFGPPQVGTASTQTGAGQAAAKGLRHLTNGQSMAGLNVNTAAVNIADKAVLGSGSAVSGSGSYTLGAGQFSVTTASGEVIPFTVQAGATKSISIGNPLVPNGPPITTISSVSGEMTAQGAIEGAKISGTVGEGVTSATTQTVSAQSLTATVWGVLQVVAWIWAIYNIIDLFGADTVTGKVQFVCKAWEPPTGGDNCEVCNDENLPCSEYRCRSLGKGCSLINEGTIKELCISSLPNDAASPRIRPLEEKINYNIQEESGSGFTISDPIPPFTAVSLGINTDEPAQCKFSVEPNIEFKDKEFGFNSQFLEFNHELSFALPSELTETQALQLTNGGKYTIYTRCEDANGNANQRDYIINFRIQTGPDLEPPQYQTTSILSGTTLQSGVEAVSIDFLISEPGTCKWSTRDIEYNLMENTFICASSAFDLGFSGFYSCSTSLPLQPAETSSVQNTFYFRCSDRENNQNRDSYRYTITSSSELQITETKPEGILRSGSGITLEVKTSGGAEDGKAICGYSTQDLPITNFPSFQNTDSSTHTQTLQLLEQGANNFLITCIDKAGNEAKSTIQFTVEADSAPPILLSVFKDSQLGILSVITNEPTTCQYSDQQFNFGSGIPMTNENSISHEASLGNNLYIIKCQDEFFNEASFTVFP